MSRFLTFILTAIFLTGAPAVALAQAGQAELTGEVRDGSGAGVANATVTVTQRSLDGVIPAFTLSAGPNVQPIPLTPDAGLGQGVFSVDRDLGSGYAQQWNLAIQREIAGNLVAEVAYAGQVFDQTIQTGPVGNFPVADSFNRALERDVSTGDIPNVFVTSFTYELPIGKGRRINLSGIADKLLGGWNINGTLTNTPPLGNPNGVLGNAAFGTITSAGDPRVIQFGLKLNF